MPRIRTIKPEFWSDEKLSTLGVLDRLIFLGLISLADDYGRVQDNVKIIDAFIFPNTDDTSRDSLASLEAMNRIKRGKSTNGMPIIEIISWDRHQKVDKPQPRNALPPIKTLSLDPFANDSRTIRDKVPNDSRISRECLANDSRPIRDCTTDQGPPTTDQGPGRGSEEPEPPNDEPTSGEQPALSPRFKQVWNLWKKHLRETHKPLAPAAEEVQLMNLGRCFSTEEERIGAVLFSIERQARNLITNGDHKRQNESRLPGGVAGPGVRGTQRAPTDLTGVFD